MSLYDESVPTLVKMLRNLDSWLAEAAVYAESRGFEPDVLLSSRLSPDMFPLIRQIQSACDGAKFVGARLAGVEAPKHADTETTFAEARARVASTLAFLEGLDRASFEGAEAKELFLPMLRGGSMNAANYAREFGMPNFFFHVTTAYGLLRHNGVKLGKMSYLGALTVKPAA